MLCMVPLPSRQFVVRWFPARWMLPTEDTAASAWHLRGTGAAWCTSRGASELGTAPRLKVSVDFWFSLFSSDFAKLHQLLGTGRHHVGRA